MNKRRSNAQDRSYFWRLVNAARPLRHHGWMGDAFGLLMFALALVLRFAVDHVLPPGFPFLTFFPAVILTTFFCGLRAGVTCAVLSTLAAWYFFVGPATDMQLTGQALLALGFFTAIAGIDILLIHFTFTAADELRAEQQTTARLYESQRTMFQELQHRVANNMQFVAALLTLHKRRAAADPSLALNVLDEARVRLDTISRIHRRLYAPERLEMPTDQYLKELCGDLVRAAGADGVTCTVETPNLPMNVTQLTTLSLLVAELVTNSLKHAFAPGMAGHIGILIGRLVGNRYALAVTDNGRGLPEGFDGSLQSSLGLGIIRGLAAQLGGAIRFENRGGTSAIVEFAVE